MYTDTILFIIGAAGFLALVISIIYLIVSSKNSKNFKRFIQEETEYNTIKNTATVMMSATATEKSGTAANTGDDYTQMPSSSDGDSDKTVFGGNYDNYTVMPHTGEKSAVSDSQGDYAELTRLLSADGEKTLFPSYDNNNSEQEQKDTENTKKGGFLDGLYVIENIIYSGPMSSVFIARSTKLDNRCIIKFVTHEIGNVSYEHDKLKNLYHISLPKIIDIFTDETGIYIVESYIEGKNLGAIIKDIAESNKVFNPHLIIDWAKQLCDVYSYLHNLPDSPIYHFDIKPENIMVTHGDRLVPIDFGISKRANDDSKIIAGLSPKYAAPEQFGNASNPRYKQIMDFRFGELPADYINWVPDARTDIFSLGAVLFELATGEIPTAKNISKIREAVPDDFANIILKCIKINPDERYKTIDEMAADLQKLNMARARIHRSMLMRKITSVTAAFAFVFSSGGFLGGSYIYQQELLSSVDVDPQIVTLSLQQSSELNIEKQMPNGNIVVLNPGDLTWSSESDDIVKIDGNIIRGMNVGKTAVQGKYRNKLVNLIVNVVEPMEGMVDIVQQYVPGHKVKLFGGTLEREHIDGLLSGEAEFASPESIDIAEDGTVYIADSGVLRRIKNNKVESIEYLAAYMTPNIIRCYKNDVYVVTKEWEDTDGKYYYGFVRAREDGFTEINIFDAVYTAVEDFGFSNNLLYYIERNEGLNKVYLKTINMQNFNEITALCELPAGTKSLTFGEDNIIYLANPETGVIQYYKNGELKYFAGIENEKAFIDGSAPLFYMPLKIKYYDNALYIWDFNVLRKIIIENGGAVDCITLAGEASPDFELESIEKEYDAENIILPNSYLTDFAVADGYVLLTDPKHGVIWQVE